MPKLILHLFQENKSYGVKSICTHPLTSSRYTSHHYVWHNIGPIYAYKQSSQTQSEGVNDYSCSLLSDSAYQSILWGPHRSEAPSAARAAPWQTRTCWQSPIAVHVWVWSKGEWDLHISHFQKILIGTPMVKLRIKLLFTACKKAETMIIKLIYVHDGPVQ